MRNHLLSSVAAVAIIVAIGGAAIAADVPVKASKAPPPAVAPLLHWNGFYIGGHLGYGEAGIGGKWDGGADQDLTKDLKGIVGGIHAGQNWQRNMFVFGWEADLSAAGLSKSVVEFSGDDSLAGLHTRIDALASLRGRLGILLNPNFMGYVTGGLAYAHGKAQGHAASTSDLIIDLDLQQKRFHKFGSVLGLGAEWKPAQNFSWRLEGLWYKFDDSKRFTIGSTGKVALDDVWVVRFGATHHFGAEGPAAPIGLPVKGVAPGLPLLAWTGPYVGGHLGYGEARIKGDWDGGADQDLTKDLKGIVGGMHVGQNWQRNMFVFGWEADLSAAGLSKSSVKLEPGDLNSLGGLFTKIDAIASLRGRLGILLNPNFLGYVTGGLAYAHGRAQGHAASTTDEVASLDFLKQEKKLNGLGSVLGLGVEWKQAQSFSWRLEGLWYKFDESRRFNIGDTGKVKLDDAWVVRVGATHHFATSGWGKAPVTTRY